MVPYRPVDTELVLRPMQLVCVYSGTTYSIMGLDCVYCSDQDSVTSQY